MQPLLERVNTFLNWEQEFFVDIDTKIYGNGCAKHSQRAWFNPMRWLLGKEKVRRLDPRKVFIENNKLPKDVRHFKMED